MVWTDGRIYPPTSEFSEAWIRYYGNLRVRARRPLVSSRCRCKSISSPKDAHADTYGGRCPNLSVRWRRAVRMRRDPTPESSAPFPLSPLLGPVVWNLVSGPRDKLFSDSPNYFPPSTPGLAANLTEGLFFLAASLPEALPPPRTYPDLSIQPSEVLARKLLATPRSSPGC